MEISNTTPKGVKAPKKGISMRLKVKRIQSDRKELETEFKHWLIEKKVILCDNYKLEVLEKEILLFKPYKILTNNLLIKKSPESHTGIIGKIDLLVKYRKNIYVSEVKYIPFKAENFWLALKCLAYCVYLKWQSEFSSSYRQLKPAIFMPKKSIKLEHKIISAKLGISLFGIIKEEGNWLVEANNLV